MLNSMDNIERHLAAICVGEGEEALLELPGVPQPVPAPTTKSGTTSPVKAAAGQEVQPVGEETIESLSTRVSRQNVMVKNTSYIKIHRYLYAF